MAHKLLPRYVSLICAAAAALAGVLALLWAMGSSGAVVHAAGPSAFSNQLSAISSQPSAAPALALERTAKPSIVSAGTTVGGQPPTAARRASTDLPPGASAEWWATVQEQLRRDMPLNSLSITPGWSASGEGNGSSFGYSVATAGDVNGDGYSDVIVGAYEYDNFSYQGKVYVYHGSAAGLETAPAFTATGENGLDYFGYSVATAGDVNGDGYADVIVGAPSYLSNTGKIYIYYGSSSGLSSTSVLSIAGENQGDYFGHSVATAGDIPAGVVA
jgi:hypothetical protein